MAPADVLLRRTVDMRYRGQSYELSVPAMVDGSCLEAEFHARHAHEAPAALERLRHAAGSGGNTFAALMDAVRVCSLGQISQAFFEVGGQYRRTM